MQFYFLANNVTFPLEGIIKVFLNEQTKRMVMKRYLSGKLFWC